MSVQEIRALEDQLTSERKEWITLFENRPSDLAPDAHAAELKRRNTVMTELGQKLDAARAEQERKDAEAAELAGQAEALRKALADDRRPVYRTPFPAGEQRDPAQEQPAPRLVLPGEALIATPGYKEWAGDTRRSGRNIMASLLALNFKTLFTTATATVTGYDRPAGIVTLGVQPPSVADLLAQGQTTQNTIRYLQEDTLTNAATTVAEGGTKPEAAFDTSEQDAAVRKIAVVAKVSDELFADFPAIRDYINERLPYMIRMTEDNQLLNGDGVAPNLRGILQTSGILTQAKGADPVPDAVYKAMVKIMSQGFFMPDGAVFNPLDWQDVKLLRTAAGEYIWGHPADAAPDRIWGLTVVLTTTIAENTALVGAFKLGAQVFYRQGITVEATNTNEDDFIKNKIAIRAEQREALAVYRPKAFCSVTGI